MTPSFSLINKGFIWYFIIYKKGSGFAIFQFLYLLQYINKYTTEQAQTNHEHFKNFGIDFQRTSRVP